MKSSFPGYIDDFLESKILAADQIIVAFDTNILLNLYRVEPSASDDILSQIHSLLENEYFDVWLPHQIALEFNTLRKTTLRERNKSVNIIDSEFKSFKKKLQGLAEVGGKNGEVYPLKVELGEHLHNIHNIIKKHSPKAHETKQKDVIGQKLFELFEGRVGDSFTQTQMSEVEEEANYRFAHNIPPGYDDSAKEESYSYNGVSISTKFGDFILWKQLIEYAKHKKRTTILVTADVKPDWQSKDFERVRPELITEFKLKTNQNFYALTLPDFERHFRKQLTRNLSPDSKSQIRELNRKDNAGWLDDIKSAFSDYSVELSLKEIYSHVEATSQRDEFPPTWHTIIRRTIYNHCSDLSAFLGKDDVFKQIRSGVYKLRQPPSK